MAQLGVLGNGVKFAVSTGSPVSWTAVPQVFSFTPPGFTADKVNKDTHSTTNNLHRYMAGLNDVSDSVVVVLSDLDPATAPALELLRLANANGTGLWFRAEIPVTTAKTSFRAIEWYGTVSGYVPDTPIGDVQKTTITIVFGGDSVGWSASVGATQIS
jgi:hypothetical protein